MLKNREIEIRKFGNLQLVGEFLNDLYNKEGYRTGRLCISYFKGTGSRDRFQIFRPKWIVLSLNRNLYLLDLDFVIAIF
jgi:hypothetical protein